ncbi:hypothetical protein EIP86_004929 [Pleurotus ostreatoroseus]|nr:hypothetical protein EIP86_004929 [Pleurotus ostreatoroseus]
MAAFEHVLLFKFELQPIIISRFLINLREAQSQHEDTEGAQEVSSARFERPNAVFASVVDPMGQSLDYGGQAAWDERVEEDFGNVENMDAAPVISETDDTGANKAVESTPADVDSTVLVASTALIA